MTLEQELARLGLKENEVKVYLASLELGEPTVGQIEKQTGLHKQLIYNAAKALEGKQLLSIYEIRGRKRFAVDNPAALEDRARARLEEAQSLIPRLLELSNKKRGADKIRIYRGKKGVHQYYLQSIRNQPKESSMYILGVNSRRYFEIFEQDGIPYRRMEQTRTSRKITWKLLLFGPKESEIQSNKGRPYLEISLIPDAVRAPFDIMIWHDHVGMLFYGDEPYVLDIVGQETVKGFREYFQVLWKQGQRAEVK